MTTTVLPTCPGCSAPLERAPACPACGLALVGPTAARLWQVDVRLAALGVEQGELRAERGSLLQVLRGGAPALEALPATGVPSPSPLRARPEAEPRSVQNTLLGVGALLLAVAATVFTAVTYERLGAGGRAAVLLALTAGAAATVPVLLRRGLSASAEAVSAVVLVLAALDAYGLRTLGLGDGLDGATWAGSAAGVLALACGGATSAVTVRLPRFAGVLLVQVAVVLLLAGAETTAGTAALVLLALATADLLAWDRLTASRTVTGAAVGAPGAALPATGLPATGLPATGQPAAPASGEASPPAADGHGRGRPSLRRDVAAVTVLAGAAVAVATVVVATVAAYGDQPRRGALALALLGALAATAAWRRSGTASSLLAAVPAVFAAAAGHALVADGLTSAQEPLVASAVGLLAVLVAAQLPSRLRLGAVVGAGAVTSVAALAVADDAVRAVCLPALWLLEPWTRSADSARAALSPDQPWGGTVVTLVVLAVAALVCVTAGLAAHIPTSPLVLVPAAVLVVASAVLLPLGLATSYPVALAVLLAVAAALLAAGSLRLTSTQLPALVRAALLSAGAATALLATLWSAADESATLAVLPVAAVLAGAVALRPAAPLVASLATAAAATLSGAGVATAGASAGLDAPQVGGLLLVGPAALLLAPRWLTGLGRPRRAGADAAACLLAATALALAAGDPGWLSWTLLGLGLTGLAAGLEPERRALAAAGALLLTASSWVRLLDADVQAPEPYVLPAGVVALALGHLRRRGDLAVSSTVAYGPGLSLCLLPSLLFSLGDDELVRSLALLGAGVTVLLVGVQTRLRAPLAAGAGVAAVVALDLLGPYAAALPRWMPLAAAGALLVALGATYEQRRRDVTALRARFEALG